MAAVVGAWSLFLLELACLHVLTAVPSARENGQQSRSSQMPPPGEDGEDHGWVVSHHHGGRRDYGDRDSTVITDALPPPPPAGRHRDDDGAAAGPGEPIYPWLYADQARYMDCLAEFQSASDEWQGVRGWIEDCLVLLVGAQQARGRRGPDPDGRTRTWKHAADDGSEPPSESYRTEYRMLGIGSGSGEIDVAILQVLLPLHPRISVVVVEPDPSQMNLYRRLVKDSQFVGTTFTYHQTTSSEFIETTQSNVTFDLIHMVHVLYHIEMAELEPTFSHYYDSLSPGGIMFIAYESDNSSLARIRSALQPFKPGMPAYMSIDDVKRALSKVVPAHQWRSDVIRGRLNVTACLLEEGEEVEEEKCSASAERLWDFITRVVHFRDGGAPKKVVRRAADLLRRYSQRYGGGGDGRMVTNVDTVVVVVIKGSDHRVFLKQDYVPNAQHTCSAHAQSTLDARRALENGAPCSSL